MKSKLFNYQINGFRSFLLIFVMLYHYLFIFGRLFLKKDFNQLNNYIPGQASVCIFFVMSGFFLHLSTFKEFAFKKTIGIFVPTLLCVLLSAFIQFLFGNLNISVLDFFMNILMLPMASNLFVYVDGAHWYIAFLLLYFIYFVLIKLFVKIIKKDIAEHILLIILSILSFSTTFLPTSLVIFKILRVLLNPHFLLINLGIFIRKISNDNIYSRTNKLFAFIVGILFVMSLVTVYRTYGILQFVYYLILFAAMILCMFRKICFLEKTIFQFIGNASLFVYLIHQEVGFLMLNTFNNIGLYLPGVVITFVTMMVIGIFLHYLYNTFVVELINKLAHSLKKEKTI